MKYAVEMCSSVMVGIRTYIKIDLDIQKLIGGGVLDSQTIWLSHKPTNLFKIR